MIWFKYEVFQKKFCQMAFECQRVAKINCDLTKSDMNYGNSKLVFTVIVLIKNMETFRWIFWVFKKSSEK